MNILNASSIRAAALAAALFVGPSIASANDNAAQMLAASGTVPVKAAGPYVQIGSYRIQVEAHLGRPSAVTADGAWLYHGYVADESSAEGTLVVRFDHGRVSQLSLVSHSVETVMLTAPASAKGQTLIASK
jgi:hypothetical protein